MMLSGELVLMTKALDSFRTVLSTYKRMLDIAGVELYYSGHSSTRHFGDDHHKAALVVKQALVAHWRRKLELELANLKTFGVDASAEMPDLTLTPERDDDGVSITT